MPLDKRILVLHTFDNQNWKKTYVNKDRYTPGLKTDACEMHTHFQLSITQYVNTFNANTLLW